MAGGKRLAVGTKQTRVYRPGDSLTSKGKSRLRALPSPAGRGWFCGHGRGYPAATGKRQPWKVLTPADPSGVANISPIQISRDGKTYAYSVYRDLTDLYLVKGLNW